MEQRTPEWFAARLGKVTASRIDDVTAKTKNGWGSSREDYMAELFAERDGGQPYPQYVNQYMITGTEREPIARAHYELVSGLTVTEIGFVDHPAINMAGASPDGLVNDDGLLEIKCPKTKTHLRTLFNEHVEGKYIKQTQWQMACTGRKWCDFVSFDPLLSPKNQFAVVRIKRDDKAIAEMERDVRQFLCELDNMFRATRDLKKSLQESAA